MAKMLEEKSSAGETTEEKGENEPAPEKETAVAVSEREELLELADRIGLMKAARHLGVRYPAAVRWREEAKAAAQGLPTPAAMRMRRTRARRAGQDPLDVSGDRKRGRPPKTRKTDPGQ
jgi:hypothetical protein